MESDIRDDKGRYKKGIESPNKKHTLESALPVFENLLDKCIKGEYLSIQACQINSGFGHSVFYDLIDQYPELEDIKKQMNDAIIMNVNEQALKFKFAPAVAIWRMKNLGEKDKQEVDMNVKEQPLFNLK